MTATKQLTVAELITKLQKRDQNMPVLIEGCDCYGDAAGTALLTNWNNPPAILITRTDSTEYTQDDDDRHQQ